MVYRVYVEKKPELAHEAKALLADAVVLLGIKGLKNVRVINRYDAENISEELFCYAKRTVNGSEIAQHFCLPINKRQKSPLRGFKCLRCIFCCL